MRPANGSAVVLKTKAEHGPASATLRAVSSPLVFATTSRSVGAGRLSTMKLRIRSVPMLCRAEQHRTGNRRISLGRRREYWPERREHPPLPEASGTATSLVERRIGDLPIMVLEDHPGMNFALVAAPNASNDKYRPVRIGS